MKEISGIKKNIANEIMNETQPEIHLGTLDSQRIERNEINNSMRIEGNKNPFEVSDIHHIDKNSDCDSRNES